ncbi:LPS export ABC transporter ATP-binding protein [Pelagibacteraceae bacterium]|nr:LPS export ABC transporter ATP-binding protein [Pelagibacteraceae bacterium]
MNNKFSVLDDGLLIKKISKTYGNKKVVRDISISIKRREIVGLLGPNGAGKTTTFYIVVGLVKPDSGNIILDGLDVSNLPIYLRGKLGISYLPQEASIFRGMSVEDNLLSIIEINEKDINKQNILLQNLLNEFDINHVRKSKSIVLSGGERRRLEIARTLATNPKYLLLDEPLTGIDPVSIEEIKVIIKKLKNRNIGVLITDHNVRETLKIVDKVYIVNEGAIFYEGDPISAVNDEKIKKFYLGSSFSL